MATTTVFYNSYKKLLLDKSIDHTNDTIKVALCTSSYTPNIDTHDFFDDITNEVSGTGYTAGGATLAGKATSVDTTDNEGVFDATDMSLSTATITARYAVIYKSTGVSSTSPLICYIDLGENKTSVASTFGITWNSEGIINIV
jgi:hypothetical protein